MSKTYIALAVATLALSACATTAPVQQAQPVLATNAVPVVISNTPSWYLRPPTSTPEVVYVIGTATSPDLSMSGTKAVVDAQSKLAFALAGTMNTMTKDYKQENGDQFNQITQQGSKRVATNVNIAGYTVAERVIFAEGNKFRTYVLLKYSVESANARKASEQVVDKAAAFNDELEQERAARKVTPVVAGRDNSGIVIRETLATSDSKPLGVADRAEEN